MDNLLFVALVAYALKSGDDIALPTFQRRILGLLKDLRIKEWEDIPWIEEFTKTVEAAKEELPEIIAEFLEMVSDYSDEELVTEASEIRLGFLINSVPDPDNPVKSLQCTYTILWEDGKLVDYICKPFGLTETLSIESLAKLSEIFMEQFVESCVHPGLDLFHNRSAKKLSDEKLKDLIGVMYAYVNEMEASQRAPYEDVIKRVQHRLLSVHEFEPPSNNPVSVLPGNGGFQCGKKK